MKRPRHAHGPGMREAKRRAILELTDRVAHRVRPGLQAAHDSLDAVRDEDPVGKPGLLVHGPQHVAGAHGVAGGDVRRKGPARVLVERGGRGPRRDEVAGGGGDARQRAPHAVEDAAQQAGAECHA